MTANTGPVQGTLYQAAAVALCIASMVAIDHRALADYLTVAADLLAWHATDLPCLRDLVRYARLLAAMRRRRG